jgi:hypothetical protein
MVNNPFYNLDFKEPPIDLGAKIVLQVRRYETRKLVIKRGLGALSLVGFWFSINQLLTELATSGFGNYLNMFFSDTKEILAMAPDFGILLLESMPVWGLLSSLVCGLVLILSVRGSFRPVFR